MQDPGSKAAAMGGADGAAGRAQAAREMTQARIDQEDAGSPPPSETPAPGPEAPRPPSEEPPSSPWRPSGHEAPPPASPLPKPGGGRALALAALALSLILPGALYAYLAASGVLDRDPARLQRLEREVETLRAAPATQPEVTRADFDKLAARLEQLERRVAAERQQPQAPSAASLDSIASEIAAASRDAKEALSLAKTAADSANSAQSATARLASIESKLVGLEKQLATLEQSVAARPKQDVNAPSILVMARAIEADLSSGVPYVGELDALSRLGAEAKLVEALRPFAEKGAPSAASLATDFETELEAARQKVADATPPANLGTGSWPSSAASCGCAISGSTRQARRPGPWRQRSCAATSRPRGRLGRIARLRKERDPPFGRAHQGAGRRQCGVAAHQRGRARGDPALRQHR